jgi:hypothetical protein
MDCTLQLQTTNEEYIERHRWMFGDLGERIATLALLSRTVLVPGFPLPRLRLARVAPYGRCLGLTCHIKSEIYEGGIWVFDHPGHGRAGNQLDSIDATTLHELLHAELWWAGRASGHKGAPWAERCQEISAKLGINVRIERPRSARRDGRITTATPFGCLSYDGVSRWPHALLDDGPSLRERLTRLQVSSLDDDYPLHCVDVVQLTGECAACAHF